jgi:hypothetical protein
MVKCMDCGFLALSRGDGILISAESEIRQSWGYDFQDYLLDKHGSESFLECAERALDMREESC